MTKRLKTGRRNPEAAGFMHMCATKSYLLQQIDTYGAKEVLDNWEGTDEEALKRLRESLYEFFPLGPCDNRDPETGKCLGHTKTL